MGKTLKGVILDLLPENILIKLKKFHSLNLIKRFDESKEPDFIVLKYLLRKGDVVMDIGANIGCYTNRLSELVSRDGLVISIEPVQSTYAILSFCVRRLHLLNVRTFNYAMAENEGIVRMEVPKYESGGLNFYQSRIVENNAALPSNKYYSVKSTTVDTIIKDQFEKIVFIKCDVEGHELPVIKGALKTIIKSQPAWLIEISSDPDERNSSAANLFLIMKQHGYLPYWFDGKTLHIRKQGDKSVNYLFLMPNHLEQLKDLQVK